MKTFQALASTAIFLALVLPAPAIGCTINDEGYEEGRVWFDFDGNGADDYCRLVGNKEHPFFSCQFVEADGTCGQVRSLNLKDMGYPGTREWADANNDGIPDFCRQVGNTGLEFTRCAVWDKRAKGFGKEVKK
jgi:hypothetical protein